MDLSTATPVEIDTALAEIYGRLYKAYDEIDRLQKWVADQEKGLAKFEAGDQSYSTFTREGLAGLQERLTSAKHTALAIRRETDPYEDEYVRRGRWSRFFLVQNNGGHIHSSMACSTCFATTRFGWLPEFSGQTEAEAVARHGAILCTVCYPSAPTEWTNGKKPGDEDVCEGSGKYYDSSQPSRTGYYSGNWGTCTGCGTRQTVSKTLKIRKHKKPQA